jgi:hypothetical protein
MTLLPVDREAEKSVLAAAMTSVDAANELLELLAGPSDIRHPPFRIIAESVFTLAASGEPTDIITVKNHLDSRGMLTRCGGASTLFDVHQAYIAVESARAHARAIATLAERQRLLDVAESAVSRLVEGGPVDLVVEGLRDTLEQALHPDHDKGKGRIRLTPASDIKPRPVIWAWEDNGNGRIPAGSLVVAAGREGTGKSSFGIWMASQITRGVLPGTLYRHPRSVVYVAVEDSWAFTLVPRLMAANADLERVYRAEVVLDRDDTTTLSLPHDLGELERLIIQHDVGLVVLDPLMSTIGASIDTHRERDVRKALDPLARLADRTGAVVLGIAHFNKGSGTDASSLITGSGAFKNVPRAILGFARDGEDGTRVMTQTKNSLGITDLPSLEYRIESHKIETDEGHAEVGRFVFGEESERTVSDLLGQAQDADGAERRTAIDFLKEALDDNKKRRTKDIEEEAREVHGISQRTLERARKKLGVIAVQEPSGPKGKSEWWLMLP